jgi:hypothetical protein
MRRAWGAFVVAILALAALGIGGYSVYQAGYRQGLLENAADIAVPAWGFYPPFGLFFGFIFLLFLFGFISRMFFWRGWRGGHDRHREWSHEHESPMEKRLAEWHQKAHEPGRVYRSDPSDTT